MKNCLRKRLISLALAGCLCMSLFPAGNVWAKTEVEEESVVSQTDMSRTDTDDKAIPAQIDLSKTDTDDKALPTETEVGERETGGDEINITPVDASPVDATSLEGINGEGTSVPTEIKYSLDGANVNLSWTAPESESPSGYYVYYSTSGTTYTKYNSLVTTTSTSIAKTAFSTDSSTENSGFYYIKISALYGESTEQLSDAVLIYTNLDTSEKTSEDTYQTIRNLITSRDISTWFVTSLSSLDWNRIYDFDAERDGMEPDEGDYLKYQESTTAIKQRIKKIDVLCYDGDTSYTVYQMLAFQATTLAEEMEVDSVIDGLLNDENGALYSVKTKSTGEKVKAVYDYLTGLGASLESENTGKNHTVYSLLCQKKGTSLAYALAFERLCRELGVKCKVIQGNAGTIAYNMTQFAEGWYFFDCANEKYKQNASTFDYYKNNNVSTEISSNKSFIANYLDNLVTKNSGQNVFVKSQSGIELYETGTIAAALSYIKTLIAAEAEDNRENFVIAFDANIDEEDLTLDAGDLASRIIFDMSGATIKLSNTSLKVRAVGLRNGRIKLESGGGTFSYKGTDDGDNISEISNIKLEGFSTVEAEGYVDINSSVTFTGLKTVKLSSGARLEGDFSSIERLIVTDEMADGSVNAAKVEINGTVKTKYFYSYVGLESASKVYRDFYTKIQDLTVTGGSKIGLGSRLLVEGKMNLGGRTYICDNEVATDLEGDFTSVKTFNSGKAIYGGSLFGVEIFVDENDEFPKTSARVTITGLLDETAAYQKGIEWRDDLLLASHSQPLCIFSVTTQDGTLEEVGFSEGETIANIKGLTAIRNGDGQKTTAKSFNKITCKKGTTTENLSTYIAAMLNGGTSDGYASSLNLEDDGRLWYLTENIYACYTYTYKSKTETLYYESKDATTNRYVNFKAFAKALSGRKTIKIDGKKYSLSALTIYVATDEKLTGGVGVGSIPLTIKQGSYDEGNSSVVSSGNAITLDLNAQKISAKSILFGDGVNLTSSAKKYGSIGAGSGITLTSGAMEKVTFLNNVTIQNNYKTKYIKATNVNFSGGLSMDTGSLLILDGKDVLAKISIPGEAYIFEIEGANVTLSSFTKTLTGTIYTGFVKEVTGAELGGKYMLTSAAEYKTESSDGSVIDPALFTSKVSSFPLNNFRVAGGVTSQGPLANLSAGSYCLVYKSGSKIYAGRDNFIVSTVTDETVTEIGRYTLWSDAVAKMNQKLNYKVVINGQVLNEKTVSMAMKMPAKALSLILTKPSESDENADFTYTGTMSFGYPVTIENVDLAGAALSGNAKSSLILKNSTVTMSKTLTMAGITELESTNVKSIGKLTLTNVYSDDGANTISFTASKDKKGNYYGTKNIIKGFVSDARAAESIRNTGTDTARACAIDLEMMDAKQQKLSLVTSPEQPIITANAEAGWFKADDLFLRKSGKILYTTGKNPSVEFTVVLLSSTDAVTYGIDGYYGSLKDALSAIDLAGDKSRYYKVEIDETASSVKTTIAFPSKLAALEIVGKTSGTSLYFKGNLVLKSNTTLKNLLICPSGKFTMALGSYSLTLDGISLGDGKKLTGISGSKLTGTSCLIIAGGTDITVTGNISKLAKLIYNSGSLTVTGKTGVGVVEDNR